MFTYFESLILGIIEGFTEFLPISSTAHLILGSKLLGIDITDFAKTFEIVIQSGAIFAVIVFYFKKFLDWGLVKKIIVAFIPTGILGIIFYKLIKTYLLGNISIVLIALFLGGIVLILFEKYFKQSPQIQITGEITYRNAFWIGLCQSVAMIPGVSRSTATIVGGMFLGVSRMAIVEFSFLLAIPTMLAATGLDIVKNYHLFSGAQFGILLVGFVASFITAFFSIKFLLGYIQKHNFKAFGWYRIALALIFVLWVFV